MTSPVLNRLIEVTGSSTRSALGLAPYGYLQGFVPNIAWVSLRNLSGRSWTAGSDDRALAVAPTSTADLLGITRLGIAIYADLHTPAPFPGAVLLAGEIGMVDSRGDRLLTWTPRDVEVRRTPFNQPSLYLYHVDAPALAREAVIDPLAVYLGFGTDPVQVSESSPTSRRVWAKQTERESLGGILSLGTGDTLGTPAAAATAQFLIRYDESLVLARAVVDDLGRIWDVTGAQGVQDPPLSKPGLYQGGS